jgi:heptosyltransferase-2
MKIGIVRLSSLGDVVLATSVLKGLREAYPGSEIVFVVRSRYVDVFKNNSYLNRVIEWGENEPFSTLLKKVRRERFDVLIDLHATQRSRSISAFSGARRVVRYRKGHLSRRISVLRKKRPPAKHVIERYLEAVSVLGVRDLSPVPVIYPGLEEMEWAREFLGRRGYSGGQLIGLAPGARRATKMWPAEKYGALAGIMESTGSLRIVVVGDERDRPVVASVLEGGSRVIDAVGETDLSRLAALLSQCDLLVSNDSGPVHVAAAVRTPVVAIFGPTVEEFGFAPYGEGNRVVSKELYCRPCSLHGTKNCPEGHFRCMEEIEPEEIFRVVTDLLRK